MLLNLILSILVILCLFTIVISCGMNCNDFKRFSSHYFLDFFMLLVAHAGNQVKGVITEKGYVV